MLHPEHGYPNALSKIASSLSVRIDPVTTTNMMNIVSLTTNSSRPSYSYSSSIHGFGSTRKFPFSYASCYPLTLYNHGLQIQPSRLPTQSENGNCVLRLHMPGNKKTVCHSSITQEASTCVSSLEFDANKKPARRRSSFGNLKMLLVLFYSMCWMAAQWRPAMAATVASDSIKTSSLGLKIATLLRSSGWHDEVIVFVLASLPVLELRGAIPVGYWMHFTPLKTTILSILGNMLPVPFILLYLKSMLKLFRERRYVGSGLLDRIVKMTKRKAGPIEEFRWLGLMLFVAVPFPGTGAWSGAIAATILDMPFWEAISANFFGVVIAGLLVNLLVNLGLKYAIVAGVFLFVVSTVMWTCLRYLKKPSTNII